MNDLQPLADLDPDGAAFAFDAADRLCVGVPSRRFLHGGVMFAACVDAMERVTGLPAIQVAAQFLLVGKPRAQVKRVLTVRSGRQRILPVDRANND